MRSIMYCKRSKCAIDYNVGNLIYNKILDRDWFSARLFVTYSNRRVITCPMTGVRFELFQIGHL